MILLASMLIFPVAMAAALGTIFLMLGTHGDRMIAALRGHHDLPVAKRETAALPRRTLQARPAVRAAASRKFKPAPLRAA